MQAEHQGDNPCGGVPSQCLTVRCHGPPVLMIERMRERRDDTVTADGITARLRPKGLGRTQLGCTQRRVETGDGPDNEGSHYAANDCDQRK